MALEPAGEAALTLHYTKNHRIKFGVRGCSIFANGHLMLAEAAEYRGRSPSILVIKSDVLGA